MSNNESIQKLRQFYKKDKLARLMLDQFASYQRNRTATKVDYLLWKLRALDDDVTRGDILRIFKELESLGYGRYVPGRWSHPSRFQWSASLVEVGKAASGEEETVQQFSEDAASLDLEEEPDLIAHGFQLRSDLQVTFELPGNLTRIEASRLAKFIESLPFSEA